MSGRRSAAWITHMKSLLFSFIKRKPGQSFYLTDSTSSLRFSPCLHPCDVPLHRFLLKCKNLSNPSAPKCFSAILWKHLVLKVRMQQEMKTQKGFLSIWEVFFLSHRPYVDLDYINEVPVGKCFNFLLHHGVSFPFYMGIRWGAYGQIPVAIC